MSTHYDCIVVGSGHAGCSAALAAAEAGCTSVLIVEKAPHDWVGGNGYFTAGAHRTVHGGLQDLLQIVRNIDIDPCNAKDFIENIEHLGQTLSYTEEGGKGLIKVPYEGTKEGSGRDLFESPAVRDTPFNTGDGFAMAQAVGAKLDANASADAGDRELSNQFTKSGYPLGIMVNIYGQRFVDEGQDFRNFTYAKFGRQILLQPERCAFQVWGADMVPFLRKEEYGDETTEKIFAWNMEELADKLLEKGLKDKECFLKTVRNYNAAVQNYRAEHPTIGWDPTVKDGLSTQSTTVALQLPKSNWALPIDQGPFLAVKVTCGITFTFGGLAIDPDTAGVLSKETDAPIKGLFCTGEMVGGLFHNNYPGGSGLTAGAVFGRKAGSQAAKLAGKSVKYEG
ncbi:FAD/NAD(P)-binding domain-containing protein [Suillus decipiens]|nr:FAD/NAD(P)-binding domain-containing protein [Suillus decipiens]